MRTSLAQAVLAAGLAAATLAPAGPARGGDDPAPSPGAAAASGLKPGEVLFRPEKGTKLAFTERAALRVVQKAGRKRFEMSGETTGPLDVTIGAFADGATEVVCAWGDVKGTFSSTEDPKEEFDTAAAAPDPRKQSFLLASRAKRTATFHVRPDGRIVEMDDLLRLQRSHTRNPSDRDLRSEYHAQWTALAVVREVALVAPLPPKRMGVTTTFQDEAIPAVNGMPTHVLRRTTTLRTLDDARVVVDATGALTDLDPSNAPGSSKKKGRDGAANARRLKVSGYAASAEFERLTGLLVRSSLRLTFDLATPFGIDGETVDGLHTTEWETVLTRRAAAASPADPAPAPAPAAPLSTPGDPGAPVPPPTPPSGEPAPTPPERK